MKKAAVIGWPIKHSLSPSIHGFWRAEKHIKGLYHRVACPPTDKDFNQCVRQLADLGYAGVNVTIPHKTNAFNIADVVSPVAEKLGVANTLTFEDGAIYADNTDVTGFQQMLEGIKTPDDQFHSALILGAGGTAPAVALALSNLGIKEISVANRTADKAKNLQSAYQFISGTIPWESVETSISQFDILVNATSLGMVGQPEFVLDITKAKSKMIVIDVVYTPLETDLIRAAQNHGLRTETGLSMLMYQAIPGFEEWFSETAKVTPELKNYLIDRLKKKNSRPLKIGLTGSIGMGKSTAAKYLETLGALTWDADRAVHRIYGEGGVAVQPISAAFPGTVSDGAVSREKLSQHLLKNPEDFKKLETIVHPLVAADRAEFIENAVKNNATAIVLDIPLLFETGQSFEFDAIIAVTADPEIRKARVLERPGMSEEKLETIISRQLPEEEKILLADYVIKTDVPLEETYAQLDEVFADITAA